MHADSARVVREDAALVAATWESVFFEVWRSISTPAHFNDLADLQVAFAKTQRDGLITHVTIVGIEDMVGFDAERRRAVERRSQRITSLLRASAISLPGRGFAASLVRGIITGITLARRSRVPMKIAASDAECLTWVAPYARANDGLPVTATELTRVLARLLP